MGEWEYQIEGYEPGGRWLVIVLNFETVDRTSGYRFLCGEQEEDMKRAECSNCSADARIVRGSRPFKETALPNVILRDVEIIRCDECGNEDPIIPHVNDLMRTLALAVVAQPYRLSGSEVRFLRKYLKKTGDQFAGLIHVDKTTLSKSGKTNKTVESRAIC